MKDDMMRYGIGLPRRYKAREKSVFAEEILKQFKEMGYRFSLEQTKEKNATVSNLVVGDIKNAKTVFVAAYDTPSLMLLPNYRYKPFDIKYNMKQDNLNLLVHFVVVAAAGFLAFVLLSRWPHAAVGMKVVYGILGLILAGTIFRFSQPIANKMNLNRNTSSLVLMLALAKELKDEKVAFVLSDHAVSSYRGLKALRTSLAALEKNKRFIVLDCLGHGQTLVAAHGPTMNQEIEKLQAFAADLELYDKQYSQEKCEQNGLALFTKQLNLVCGDIEEREFFVKNTRSKHDIYVDFERLEKIKTMLIAYVQSAGKE